jgi:TolA-binding protein
MADTPTIEDLQLQVAARESEIGSLQERVEELETELADEKAKHRETRHKLRVERADKPAEARRIGAMKPPKNDGEAAARGEALEAAFAAPIAQVVFSDGKRELRDLNPLIVPAHAWRETAQGHILDHEPMLEPGDCIFERIELRGFALLTQDGDQVAYQALPEPMILERNRLYQLPKGTIRF